MKTNKFLYILPIALSLVACEPEFEDVDFNGGSADFSSFVTVGNSLTAGVQSNALSANGQLNSISNIIAGQLKIVGGGEFKQPIIPGQSGELGVGVVQSLYGLGFVLPELKLTYVTDCRGETSLGPSFIPAGFDSIPLPPPFPPKIAVPKARYSNAEFAANVSASGPYNNVGISGAKVIDIDNAAFQNPYFGRMISAPGETMIDLAMKVDASFFLLWLGSNDVLSYATGGGDESAAAITPSGTFSAKYKLALDSLMKNNAKGVVANIPDVTSIPYFTTVKWNALILDAQQAMGLNGAFAQYNALVEGNRPLIGNTEADKRKISFKEGVNGFVVLDASLSDLRDTSGNVIPNVSIRQMNSRELLTLTIPGDRIKCEGFGSVDTRDANPLNWKANPITENYLIDEDELSKINNAVSSFNSTIKSEASARGLAMFDANSRLKELASSDGINISGINFNSTFVTGGAFSLDGVHPSTRGYAIISNDFIKAINSKYGANIPQVDVASYPALEVSQ